MQDVDLTEVKTHGKELGPGVYEYLDELHVDCEEVCEAIGVPPNEANAAMVERAALEIARGEGIEFLTTFKE